MDSIDYPLFFFFYKWVLSLQRLPPEISFHGFN
jgi:hypothetical protein